MRCPPCSGPQPARETARETDETGDTGREANERERIAHRSGNAGRNSVPRRYAAPDEPPVPVLAPMIRSTILTCL